MRPRRAKEKDIDALDRLEHSLYTTDIVDADEWRKRLKRRSNEVWLIEDDKGLLASLLLVNGRENTRVEGIQVARRAQGKGYGRKMLEHAVRRAKANHKARVTLEVATQNTRAIETYTKFGFRRRGTILGYYEDGDDAIRMTYELAQQR